MEIKYKIILYAGMTIVVVLFILLFVNLSKGNKYIGGKKVTGPQYENDPYFKRKKIEYNLFSCLMMFFFIATVAVAAFMISTPYNVEVTEKEIYNRDIILCIDVSSSVDQLNLKLVGELKDTVKNMKGERFGIIIFNSSPVVLVPLTDDYDYILEQLDLLEHSFQVNVDAYNSAINDDYEYSFDLDSYYEELDAMMFLINGTLIGVEERGSSLIGDGLASCINNFSDYSKERTRLVILSTDNEVEGKEIFTLEEAATLCSEKGVKVYGIGTNGMTNSEMNSMQAAVEGTGGKFYVEEEKSTFSNIINDIEKESKSLLKGNKEYREIPIVRLPFIILLICVTSTLLLIKITKR